MKLSWKTLSGLFVLQLAVFFLVNSKERQTTVYSTNQKLIAFKPEAINKVIVSAQNESSVVLKKKDGKWNVANLHDFPAYSEKTEEFLNRLLEYKKSWPAGTSQSASLQLGTSERNYEKKFQLFSHNKLVHTIYIGSSPSFKKVHARVEGQSNTYEIAFNSFDFSTDANEWIDRSQYALERKNIKELRVKGIVISNDSSESGASLATLGPSEVSKDHEVNRLLNNAISPGYHKVLGGSDFNSHGREVLNYQIVTNKGSEKNYHFYEMKHKKSTENKDQHKTEQSYVMKVSDSPYYLEVDRSAIQELLNLKRENLVEKIDHSPNKEIISMKSGEANKESK